MILQIRFPRLLYTFSMAVYIPLHRLYTPVLDIKCVNYLTNALRTSALLFRWMSEITHRSKPPVLCALYREVYKRVRVNTGSGVEWSGVLAAARESSQWRVSLVADSCREFTRRVIGACTRCLRQLSRVRHAACMRCMHCLLKSVRRHRRMGWRMADYWLTIRLVYFLSSILLTNFLF